MKKQLLLVMALIAATVTYGQLEVRPYVGMNFTDVTRGPSNSSTAAKLGGQVGASVLIGNRFHLMPGIAYFSHNTSYSSTGPGGDINFDQTVNGVQIPLLIGYRFVDAVADPLFNVRLFAGPAMQFLTRTSISDGLINDEVDWSKNSWQAMVGLGLDVKFVFLDIGYTWGLSNTGEARSAVSDWSGFRSNTFLINLGVRLNLAD